MRTIVVTLVATLAAALAASAFAQPQWAKDKIRHCLAAFPNNDNLECDYIHRTYNKRRFYFDAKSGPNANYMLLMRPWMHNQSQDGSADWRITHLNNEKANSLRMRQRSDGRWYGTLESRPWYTIIITNGEDGSVNPWIRISFITDGVCGNSVCYRDLKVHVFVPEYGGECFNLQKYDTRERVQAWGIKNRVEKALDFLRENPYGYDICP